MRITRQFKSSLRTLKTRLQQGRRDPAWHFADLSSRKELQARTERMPRAELCELRNALDAIETQIGSWARQAEMNRKRPRRRPLRADPEFFF